MISIDDVYQKVLALTNKEQRGYLTPQEFNLMANKAQREIYDSYFHNTRTAELKNKTQADYSDIVESIELKLAGFKRSTSLSPGSDNEYSLSNNVYKVISVSYNGVEITKLTEDELLYTENNPLTKANLNRMVYVDKPPTGAQGNGSKIKIYPSNSETQTYTINVAYYKEPDKPNWPYIVVRGRALYNGSSNTLVNFSLHPSEEENLVNRILQLAGVVVMKPGLVEIGMSDRANVKQEQND
tara:strand:+ start:1163 stop:1885 length:723 start_codon:yes stop_codon:yes gene_type:complete